MPSRPNRNARNKHVTQQPTPSSRPSPNLYPSSLPDDSANSSSDDSHSVSDRGRLSAGPGPPGEQPVMTGMKGRTRKKQVQVQRELEERPADTDNDVEDVPQSLLVDFESEPDNQPSLPTPPIPEALYNAPLSPLWDIEGTRTDGHIRSPILSTLSAANSANSSSKSLLGEAFARASRNQVYEPPISNPSTSPPSPSGTSSMMPIHIPSSSPVTCEEFAPTDNVQDTTAPSSDRRFRARTETAIPSRSGTATSSVSPSGPVDLDATAGSSMFDVNASTRTADLNDMTIDMMGSERSMEGTIRPPKKPSSGYGYGFPAPAAGDLFGEDAVVGGYGGPVAGHSRRTSYGQTVRGSGLSQAMAYPASGSSKPQAHRLQQNRHDRAGVAAAVSHRRPSVTNDPVIGGSNDMSDTIIWARWDHSLSGRRLLFLSYHPSGMQIWDCTDLGSISEVLNLSATSVHDLVFGDSGASSSNAGTGVLPSLSLEYAGVITNSRDSVSDEYSSSLVGVLVSPASDDKFEERVDEASDSVLLNADIDTDRTSHAQKSTLLVYSLANHQVVKKVELAGLATGGGRFEVGDGFVAVSTTQPPSIYVLSSTTFEVLHHIPSSDLMPFCHRPSSHGISSSQSSSRRHSFLATTSSIVNGIYNNYHEHFNDNHNNNNKNVFLPTVDNLSITSSPSTETGHYEYPRQRRPTLQEQSLRGVNTRTSAVIPEPSPVPAPVFSVSGRLLAYASLPYGDASSHLLGVQPRTSSTLSSAAVSTASAFGSSLSSQFANLSGAGGGASGALGALGGISQADLGNAALKVGGSVLSGMKNLGGLAYKGAVAAASASVSSTELSRDGLSMAGEGASRTRAGMGGVGALANRFFSKSAPAATGSDDDRKRRFSIGSAGHSGIEGYESGRTSGAGEGSGARRTSTLQRTVPPAESGYYVTILDIAPLLSTSGSKAMSPQENTGTGNVGNSQGPTPTVISQFIASKSQPVASVWFSPNGTSLLITPRDGQSVSVVELQSNPISRKIKEELERDGASPPPDGKSKSGPTRRSSLTSNLESPPVHMYNLRRGRTPAAIESANWASDGRWLAIGTRKRTVHVFAVNPYGGRSDIRSHMEGKVSNYTELPLMPTDLYPLVRLRVTKNPTPEQPRVPLAFLFLESSWEAEQSMPTSLLPPITSPNLLPSHSGPHQHSYGSVSSNHTVMSSSPSARSEPISPSRQYFSPSGRPRNYQDVLVFDPTDGTLSLRRITVDVKPKSNGAGFVGMGGSSISRSLPGMGAAGRLSMSASPNASAMHGRIAASGILPAESSNEFIGKEQTVATWNLRRSRDWGEIRKVVEDSDIQTKDERIASAKGSRVGKANWLAQAELSTCSKSTRVLPRSVYLSHQFSFHALGEDYHALIRRYQFDFSGTKIEVRKGVEVSAFPTGGGGESFVEGGGFTALRDRRASSSFDEPLASALAGDMDHAPTQPVLPMLPNGTPGSKPRTFIPIRTTMTGLSDGMSGSIGRFRREITKVRSPKLRATDNSMSASVPLEFDEEDEDFVSRGDSNWPADGGFDQERLSGPTSSDLAEESPSSGSVPTAVMDPLDTLISDDDVSVEDWQGWGHEDRKAVEEAEMFDHISAVGFLDEEQEMMAQAQTQAQVAKSKKAKGRKKRI